MQFTATSLGDYDQCLDLNRNQVPDQLFDGQYCSIDLFPLVKKEVSDLNWIYDASNQNQKFELGRFNNIHNMPYTVGLCVPSSCSSDEIRQVLGHGQ